jgi:hypothetical protein
LPSAACSSSGPSRSPRRPRPWLSARARRIRALAHAVRHPNADVYAHIDSGARSTARRRAAACAAGPTTGSHGPGGPAGAGAGGERTTGIAARTDQPALPQVDTTADAGANEPSVGTDIATNGGPGTVLASHGETDAGHDANADRDSETDFPRAHAEANTHAHAHRVRYTDTLGNRHSDPNAHTHLDPDADADAHAQRDRHTDRHRGPDTTQCSPADSDGTGNAARSRHRPPAASRPDRADPPSRARYSGR